MDIGEFLFAVFFPWFGGRTKSLTGAICLELLCEGGRIGEVYVGGFNTE